MIKILNAYLPPLKGAEVNSSDPYKNTLNHLKKALNEKGQLERPEQFDYILCSRDHRLPKTPPSFTEIRPVTSGKKWYAKGYPLMNELSDHSGVYAHLVF